MRKLLAIPLLLSPLALAARGFDKLPPKTRQVAVLAGALAGVEHTDHAEAVEITYDASRITYSDLLKVFFSAAHDPTTFNRRGPDRGKQYRSALFYSNDEQKHIAQAYVTQIAQLKQFYPAEAAHQDFVRNHPTQGYVVINTLPKLEKLTHMYPELVKKK